MFNCGGFTVEAFVAGTEWAKSQDFPAMVCDWTKEHNDRFQKWCEEYDREKREKSNHITSWIEED